MIMDTLKNIGASILAAFSWVGAISVQDTVTFILASTLTIVTIVFVIYGIRNRAIERKIKQKTLNELTKES